MKPISLKTYLITLFLTVCIFFAALYISSYINKEKTQEIQSGEDKIAIDIMQLDSELSTLKTKSCSTVTTPELQSELDSLNSRLTFMEQQVGAQDSEVFRLKRYFAQLEGRDYLLTTKAAQECNQKAVFIIYFYSNNNCPMCTTEQYILDAVKDAYPKAYVYSFDYDYDLPSVQSLISLPKLPTTPPIVVINGKVYQPFSSLNDIENVINPLLATSTASSTLHSAVKK